MGFGEETGEGGAEAWKEQESRDFQCALQEDWSYSAESSVSMPRPVPQGTYDNGKGRMPISQKTPEAQ